MEPETTPEEIRRARFGSAFRGLDRTEVEAYLARVATRIEQLETEKTELAARLDEGERHDLESEFEKIGREVTAILQTAREAADAMRERASLDAARWRSEAIAEAEENRRQAAADAEAMRRDAWVTGTELLQQASEEVRRMRDQAERDVLTIQGEAEREAHRLVATARREAEDLTRNASMEAEKMTAEATQRRDEIILQANRQAAAAQERTRALEQRREELLEELENVRATLTRLEGSLEERREILEAPLEDSTSVRVVQPAEPTREGWELGETVRVVPSERARAADETTIADEVSEEVARLRDRDLIREQEVRRHEPVDTSADTEDDEIPSSEAVEPDDVSNDVDSVEEAVEEGESENDVEALFASLRSSTGDGADVQPTEENRAEPGPDQLEDSDAGVDEEPDSSTGFGAEPEGFDWIEERDARLLPVTNRALRGIKKTITELQNIVLDSLRTDEAWKPDPSEIAGMLHAEVVGLWTESYAAGHAVAEKMTGAKIRRPPTPASEADDEFARALIAAVTRAISEGEGGPRERQAAASRVFRIWRTDEAERRVRELAIRAYQLGIEHSTAVGADASGP